MFVRFVVGGDDENAAWLTGVIRETSKLCDGCELYDYEYDLLQAAFGWFNEHLPCPPFRAKLRSGKWTCRAVAWFRSDAGEPLRRIWDIVAVLKEHGVPVRMLTSNSPGKIVYADAFQIVAETHYWA
jgi:hypothetical protein